VVKDEYRRIPGEPFYLQRGGKVVSSAKNNQNISYKYIIVHALSRRKICWIYINLSSLNSFQSVVVAYKVTSPLYNKNDENEVKDWNSEYRKSGDLKTVDGLRHETFSQAYMTSYILHTHEKDHYGTTNFLTGAGL